MEQEGFWHSMWRSIVHRAGGTSVRGRSLRSPLVRMFCMLHALLFIYLLWACASMGTPDGGPYDETPPKLIKSTPEQNAVRNQRKEIVLEFDEYIKLENANEKVVVSPPQLEQPEIKASGRKIIVALQDTLKENTTYTIDFSDAIVDNNEGNPMGNFTYAFSTGESIDSMEVAGTVLNAADLEPIKGILVGLQRDTAFSSFHEKPLERVSRTNGSGRFIIRGVAPGSYRIYALQDVNQNFLFDQKSEMIAFQQELIVPSSKPDIRMDTLWTDSIHYDSIVPVHYTHFLPDDVVLRAFTEEQTDRYLVKNERLVPQKFSFYFSSRSDTLPRLEGLNFDAEESLIIERNERNDTLHYWIKDSLVYKLDTLDIRLSYWATDTLGGLSLTHDTLYMSSKKTMENIRKEKERKLEDWLKEQKKKEKKGLAFDSIPPVDPLELKLSPSGAIDPDSRIRLSFTEPLARLDTAGIHLCLKEDTLWNEVPYLFEQVPGKLYEYQLVGEWRPEQEYELRVDSAICEGIYGLVNAPQTLKFSIQKLDAYSALFLNIRGVDGPAFVELLSGDKPVKQVPVVDGNAEFYFIKPGKYYVRLVHDRNGDGKWTTGNFDRAEWAEEVYYYPTALELKEKWDISQDWDVTAVPLEKQKPEEIVKQKPDKEKSIKNRNAEREKNKRK